MATRERSSDEPPVTDDETIQKDTVMDGASTTQENASSDKETQEVGVSKTESAVDGFKVPAAIVRQPTKKSAILKYMQQRSRMAKLEIAEPSVDEQKDTSLDPSGPAPPPLEYDEPDWGGPPEDQYVIEEIKSGVIEKCHKLNGKSYFTIGRVDACDIPMAHPTVSRYHAILQYRADPDEENGKGFYLYDMKSTHGTFLNKYQIKSRVYARVRVGHMVKIGKSSRFFILQGPAEDEEDESDLTVTELKAKRLADIEERKRKEEQAKLDEEMERERKEKLWEERGIDWGMGEDADEETDLSENPYAVLTNEELYIDDPKKALRQWYEREGEDLRYEIEKAEKGMFVCKLVLPIDDEDGREVIVETSGRSKREAQVQCALEACRAIDKQGLLRPAKRESKKVKKRNWEDNDYYDSDEDTFQDRTGEIERKREKRMRESGKLSDTVETYASLKIKYHEIIEKLKDTENRLAHFTELLKRDEIRKKKYEGDDVDALDSFMAGLSKSGLSHSDLNKLKAEITEFEKEEVRLRQLLEIAKPANMPALKPYQKPVAKPPTPTKVEQDKQPEVTGTTLTPDPTVLSKTNPEDDTSNTPKDDSLNKPKGDTSNKPKAVIGPTLPSKNAKRALKNSLHQTLKSLQSEDEADDNKEKETDFVDLVWKPPPGQTGDGRTSLNDKFGY